MVPQNHILDVIASIRRCNFRNLPDLQDHFHWSKDYASKVKRACIAAGLITAEEWKLLVPGKQKGLERHHRCPTCRWLNPPSDPFTTPHKESTY